MSTPFDLRGSTNNLLYSNDTQGNGYNLSFPLGVSNINTGDPHFATTKPTPNGGPGSISTDPSGWMMIRQRAKQGALAGVEPHPDPAHLEAQRVAPDRLGEGTGMRNSREVLAVCTPAASSR